MTLPVADAVLGFEPDFLTMFKRLLEEAKLGKPVRGYGAWSGVHFTVLSAWVKSRAAPFASGRPLGHRLLLRGEKLAITGA